MRCNTIAKLHSPHACRRLYNARNCITASLSGHNGKFIMMMSTTSIIPRTHTKSGHEIRSATPKMHPQAPHRNGEKAWFTQASPRAKQEDVDIETLTQPQAPYVTNMGRKNKRERGSQGRKPTCKTLSQIRCEVMKDKVDQGETQRAYVHALSDSGSHICKKERRPGRTPKRLATTKISMRSDLHTPFAKSRGEKPSFCFSLVQIDIRLATASETRPFQRIHVSKRRKFHGSFFLFSSRILKKFPQKRPASITCRCQF